MEKINQPASELNALRQVYTCIDHTTLEGGDNSIKVKSFCERVLQLQDAGNGIGHVAAVCVYPVFVRQARQLLEGSGIRVASVAGAFPSGQSPLAVKLQEVKYAVDEGADEVDMVISRGTFLAGDHDTAAREIEAIRAITRGITLKVILETGELQSEQNIACASRIALEAGADFIKTSTGKIAVSATEEAARVMLQEIKSHYERTGRWAGFKAAGGISTPEQVLKYYRLAEQIVGKEHTTNQFFRIGASRLTENLFSFLCDK